MFVVALFTLQVGGPVTFVERTQPAPINSSSDSDDYAYSANATQTDNNKSDSRPEQDAAPTQTTPTLTESHTEEQVVGTEPALSKTETLDAHNEFVQESVLGDSILADAGTYPLRSYETSAVSTDPLGNQWWESELNLPDTWDTTTGDSGVVLAIIDTAFSLDHEELAGRWHANDGESGTTAVEAPSLLNCTDRSLSVDASCNRIDDNFDGIVDNEAGVVTIENPSQLNCSDQSRPLDKSCNLIDDDNNGLIDDWRGWDFINFDRSVVPGETNPNGSGTRHGTYVASVAAANGNNGIGIAGVNWGAKVLPIQALDDDGYGNTLSVARSIRYAVQQGADVISLSLGSTLPDSYLLQSIREAMSVGVTVVAASGNAGCDCIGYPANYPEVVAVGALDESRNRASFSSYGANLDILAPGTNFITASWAATNQTSLYALGVRGTSLSTPLVSASLALLKGVLPDASTTELLAVLGETSDSLFMGASSVRSDTIGYGTVDLHAALERAIQPTHLENAIGYQAVSHGGSLGNVALDADGSVTIYGCDQGTATTPIYRLTAGSDILYSASLTEYAAALQSGYSASLLAYGCVAHAHDTVSIVRELNTGLEFDNVLIKRQ